MRRLISEEAMARMLARTEKAYQEHLADLPNYKTGAIFGPGSFTEALTLFNFTTEAEPKQIIKMKRENWSGSYLMNGKYTMGEGVMAISPEILEKCLVTEEDKNEGDWVVYYTQPVFYS